MENQALRHTQFSDLPFELQLKIVHCIDSRLTVQKIRSLSRLFRLNFLPVQPPYQQREMVIPFFDINGEVSSQARFAAYEVFNCRDGGWVVQLSYNLNEENDTRSVRFMHPLTMLPLTSVGVQQRIFNPVSYDTIEMPASYFITEVDNGVGYSDVAFCPESIWTVLEKFMILMIWNGRLALYKSIDKSWGFIEGLWAFIEGFCVDVICLDTKFYALESTGRTFMVHADRTMTEVVGPIVGINGHKKSFVESGGNLLLVDQYYENPEEDVVNRRRTIMIVVFERVGNIWVRIHTLGERVLFIGYYNRFSAAAIDIAGARGGLIYLAEAFSLDNVQIPQAVEDEEGDDLMGFRRHDVAFFDMVDGSITELRRPGGATYAACFWPPPAWTADAAV